MSSAKQKKPVQVEQSKMKTGNWAQHFPVRLQTEQESCLYVKKLVTLTLSSISYLRCFLPEDCFVNRTMDGTPLKILREGHPHPLCAALTKCIRGLFDALENKYLKEFLFIVYLDQNDPDNIHEMYNFSFSYNDGVTSMTNLSTKDEVGFQNRVYNSTRHLIRNIILLTQSFPVLPNEAQFTVKLTYYDHTPDEYEPPGFKACDLPPNLQFEHKIRGVETHHHTIKVGVRGPPDLVGAGDVYMSENALSETHRTDDRKKVVCPETSDSLESSKINEKKSEKRKLARREDSDGEPSCSVQSKQPKPGSQVEETSLSCYCEIPVKVGPTFVCFVCEEESHAICYFLFYSADVPKKGACLNCCNDVFHCINTRFPDKLKKHGKEKVKENAIARLLIYMLLVEHSDRDRIINSVSAEVFDKIYQGFLRMEIFGGERGDVVNQEALKKYSSKIFKVQVDVDRLIEENKMSIRDTLISHKQGTFSVEPVEPVEPSVSTDVSTAIATANTDAGTVKGAKAGSKRKQQNSVNSTSRSRKPKASGLDN